MPRPPAKTTCIPEWKALSAGLGRDSAILLVDLCQCHCPTLLPASVRLGVRTGEPTCPDLPCPDLPRPVITGENTIPTLGEN